MRIHRLNVVALVAAFGLLIAAGDADARKLSSRTEVLEQIPRIRPEYPIPNEPNQLFYIQRSVNDNTVIYAAHLDGQGHLVANSPVDVYWRWYNVDGHKKPLNFIERMMAYGVQTLSGDSKGHEIAVELVALPERKLSLDEDESGRPEALLQMDHHTAKLIYVYLKVDDSGFMPNVTAIDVFGIDKVTGKALHEHIVRN